MRWHRRHLRLLECHFFPKTSRTQRVGQGIGSRRTRSTARLQEVNQAPTGGAGRCGTALGSGHRTPHRPCSEAPAERAARPSAGRDIPRVTAPRSSCPPLRCRCLTCRAARPLSGHRGDINREAQGKPFLCALLSSSLNVMKRSQGCCSTGARSCRVLGGLQERSLPLTRVHEPGTAQEEIFPQLWDQIPPPDERL